MQLNIFRHCERSAAIQTKSAIFTIAWIASLTLAMTVLLSFSAIAAPFLYDTTDPKAFDCDHIVAAPQEAACKGGLVQSNIDLAKDLKTFEALLGNDGKAGLKKSQDLWHESRNASCELERSGRTGTQATSSFIACLITFNKSRHEFLKALILENEGSDERP